MDYDTSKVQQQIDCAGARRQNKENPTGSILPPPPTYPTCQHIRSGETFVSTILHVWAKATCKSSMSLSSVGNAEYVGEKQNPFRIIIGHCSYIKDNRSETPAAADFNIPRHSLSDLTILDQW